MFGSHVAAWNWSRFGLIANPLISIPLHRIVTLPTTMRCMIDEMKHDERIARFVLSLGIYLNTNGECHLGLSTSNGLRIGPAAILLFPICFLIKILRIFLLCSQARRYTWQYLPALSPSWMASPLDSTHCSLFSSRRPLCQWPFRPFRPPRWLCCW